MCQTQCPLVWCILSSPLSGPKRLGLIPVLKIMLIKAAGAVDAHNTCKYVLSITCYVLDMRLRFIKSSLQPRTWFLFTSILQMSELRLGELWSTVT